MPPNQKLTVCRYDHSTLERKRREDGIKEAVLTRIPGVGENRYIAFHEGERWCFLRSQGLLKKKQPCFSSIVFITKSRVRSKKRKEKKIKSGCTEPRAFRKSKAGTRIFKIQSGVGTK